MQPTKRPRKENCLEASDMARMVDPYVKCPFYQWEEGVQLCCEGMFNGTLNTHTTFENKKSRLMHERTVCKMGWGECPLAQAAFKKYERV